MGGVLEFSLTSKGKSQSWTLTPSPASLILGKVDKPDTIIMMSDEDCFAVMKGQKDSTELFFDGALKIKGDMSLAMKLGSLKESTLKANPTNGTSLIVSGFKSSTIFAEIEAGIKQNPNLVKEFDAVYEFALTSGKEKVSFTVDLKAGKVYAGKPTSGGADVTLIMSDADCFEIMSGTKDSTELFFDGALKIKGDMSLAMKLGSLKDHRSKVVQPTAAATPSKVSVNVDGFKSSAVFSEILNGLNESPDLVKEFGVVYEFKLTNASGKTQSWTVDLKDSKVVASAPSKSDCTIIMSDENCFNVMTGKADATELFFDGGLKVKGDMSLAMKLSSLKEKGIKSKL
jgi:putative sterol carrier protein